MLDIKLFRENPTLIKESEKRRFKNPKLVDEVLKYDLLWRKEIAKLSKLRSMRNTVSREINVLKKAGKSATSKIKAMRETSEKISKIDANAKKHLRARDELRYKVGNILDESVPIAKDESGNVTVRKWGRPTKFRFKPKHQADLIKLIDGASLISSVPGLKANPHTPNLNPERSVPNSFVIRENRYFFCFWFLISTEFKIIGSSPNSFDV